MDAFIILDVQSFQTSADGKTFVYTVLVKTDQSEHFIHRKYSEFRALNSELMEQGILALPDELGVTLVRPQMPHIAQERLIQLNNFLSKLLRRPEVVLSETFLNFLEIPPETIEPISFLPIAHAKVHPHLSCVASVFSNKYQMIFSCYRNTLASSFLDVTWGFIETVENGGLAIFRHPTAAAINESASSSNPHELDVVFQVASGRRLYDCMVFDTFSSLIVFDEVGVASLYSYDNILRTSNLELLKTESIFIEAHAIATNVSLSNPKRIYVIGSENGLRCIDIIKTGFNVVSSGRLENEFVSGTEQLKSLISYPGTKGDYCLIGTADKKLLIYNACANPPCFVACLDCAPLFKKQEPDKTKKTAETFFKRFLKAQPIANMIMKDKENGITDLCLCALEENNILVMSVGDYVVLLNIESLINDIEANVEKNIELDIFDYIFSVMCPPFSTNECVSACTSFDNLLFMSAMTNIVVINIQNPYEPKLIFANEFSMLGTIRDLKIIQGHSANSGCFCLMVSSSVGGFQLFDLRNFIRYNALASTLGADAITCRSFNRKTDENFVESCQDTSNENEKSSVSDTDFDVAYSNIPLVPFEQILQVYY